jgi:adenylosuccinate synthase
MSVAIVNDTFWGDCGKGWAVSRAAPHAYAIVRFNGGCNAGHSVPYQDKELNYHQIPSALHLGKICVMGNGIVFNPPEFFKELEELKVVEPSISTDTLYLSNHAHVTMPYHIKPYVEALEELLDAVRTGKNIGTTGRGIGPTYADKANRRYAVRVEDLIDQDKLVNKVSNIVPVKQGIVDFYKSLIDSEMKRTGYKPVNDEEAEINRKILDSPPLNASDIIDSSLEYGRHMRDTLEITDTSKLVNDYIDDGKNVLLEAAQGGGLDVDFCTDYPNCTSSNTITGAACIGAGVSPDKIEKRIGVVKAYCSRVGSGAFPTEIFGKIGDIIRARGKEFGRSTGRKRRVGWLDGKVLRDGSRLNGYNGLAVIGLNTLAELPELKVCVDYKVDGTPIYSEMKPWPRIASSEVESKGLEGFPQNAIEYLDLIAELGNAKVIMIDYDFGKDLILEEIF